MFVKLLAITPNSEELIEYAGRVCWRSELSSTDDGTAKFIKALIRREHLSVLEHASATFEVKGISTSCTHQLVRHRLASYSQESMRYVAMDSQEMVLPPLIAENPEAREVWDSFAAQATDVYRQLRSLGIAKEDARFALPRATQTRIVATQNFRSWRHFIELRCEKHAQWEIRAVATEILRVLHQEAPAVFGDLYAEFVDQQGSSLA